MQHGNADSDDESLAECVLRVSPGLGADQLATHTHASLFVATTAGGEKLFNDVQCALKRAPRRRSAPNVPCGVPLGSALINSSLNTHASLYVTTTGGEEKICNTSDVPNACSTHGV